MIDAGTIVSRASTLQRFWYKRDKKMKDWYSQIEMIDLLAQKDMESFVGNDPRSSFNLVLGMLDQKIPHRLPPEDLSLEEIAPAAELSRLLGKSWSGILASYRRRGRHWMRDFISLLLATGWYSVFATISLDGSTPIAEIWNPVTVYPMWDDTLVECAHIFPVNEVQAGRMIARNGWNVTTPSTGSKTNIYDYWWLEGFQVWNGIALGTNVVKSPTHETRFDRIPIFIAPVGGLPDTGDLASRGNIDRWKEELGQSLIATNENIYAYWNKWWTFSMQLLRDTAQARTYEKSSSATRIVKPEDWYRRGAHFKMGPQDDIGFISPPAIPVELRSTQLDMEAMMQRGGPSWAAFGAIQQRMTAYAMSQIAASTTRTSKPYHQAVQDCLSDIDNFWLRLMKEYGYKPYGMGLPEGLPADTTVMADYELRVPGDIIARATVARMLNPNFELSEEKIMEELFPEIKNPMEELARVRAGKARQHPLHAAISLIESFREEARLLRAANDVDGAVLYEKAANLVEASMTQGGGEAPPETARPPGIRPEVRPPPEARPGPTSPMAG